ncbi:MAG: tyrosine-type recombinase/integrase [Elusimicrobiota bacterium]
MLKTLVVPSPIPLKPQDLSLDALKTAWLQHMKLRNLSPLTVGQRRQELGLFLDFLQKAGVQSVHQINRETLERFKLEISGHKTRRGTTLTVGVVRARVFAVQGWFRFLKKRGVIKTDPLAGVEVPREAKILPRGVFSHEELRRIMAQPDLHSFVGYRDRVMMEVLYSTGMRAAELSDLKVQDVDLENKVARVIGKGNKERPVLLTTPCVRFLARYINEVRPRLAKATRFSGNNWRKKFRTGGDHMFLSAYGGTLGSIWLGAIMRGYIARSGITRPVSPVHGFRHTIATHLLEDGMSIRYVQVFLGHSNINSTRRYTHVARKMLQKQLKDCHPISLQPDRVQPFVGLHT